MLDLFSTPKPIIGMVHLLPLPGSPRYGGSLADVLHRALSDADALAAGGVHGLMVENFGDSPFFPDRVPAHVISSLTMIAAEIKRRINLPLGINVLRNDGRSALAIALAAEAQFIRVNILCGARVTDQGIIQGIAHDLQRERTSLGATHIRVLADVDVKHSSPLGERRSLKDEIDDTIHRGLADGIAISGAGTGKPTDPARAREAKLAAGATPVFIGSGVNEKTIAEALRAADGVIVGTALKVDGIATNPVDPVRVRTLVVASSI
ncbi:MAG: BtpA/SgcQ family protein [Phycisphaeraceae bacterium]